MRNARVFVVAAVAALSTFGFPSHAIATGVEPSLETTLPVAGAVAPRGHLARRANLPWRANLVGVSFLSDDREAHGVTVELRALVAGTWGEWTEARTEADEAPDPTEEARASRRVFTDGIWLGRADDVEVRVSAASGAQTVRDVRLHAFNTLGDARPGNPIARAVRTAGRWLTASAAAPAEAYPRKPDIISRRGWGADEDLRTDGPGLATSLKMAFVHHTANSNSYSRSESDNLVRGIYRYHTKTRGYSDIAYNFLVDKYGQIFEGRWGGITKAVIGAHTKGFNTSSTGVALLGTFSSTAPRSDMLSSLRKILAWKLDVHHVPPTGKVTMTSAGGDREEFNRIAGHRDAVSTACPGYEMYRRLGWLRDAVNDTGRPKIYLPSISSTTLRRDGDGAHESVTVSARFSQTVAWTLSFLDGRGTVRRRFTGTADRLSLRWYGTLANGLRAATGRYTWTLTAKKTSTGHPSTPADGSVYVINDHPSGTPLRDSTGRYTIIGGKRRPATDIRYAAKYGALPPVATGPSERARYPSGPALPLRIGALFAGPDGSRYIWSDGRLREFLEDEAGSRFSLLGYQEAALVSADQSFLDSLAAGPPVEDLTVHPEGTVVKDPINGAKWVIEGGRRRPITTLARRSHFRATEVISATAADLELPIGSSFPIRTGSVVAPTDGGRPWLAGGSEKRRFSAWKLFYRMGYTDQMLVKASAEEIAVLTTGPVYG